MQSTLKPTPFIILVFFLQFGLNLSAQVFSDKEVGKKNEAINDSLSRSEYPYSLPIWGEKATKAGYNLPYSAGLSVQYFGQKSDIVINNLSVGFNGGTMYDLDEIVQFTDTRATAQAITARPDIWLFPFLNVYGILGTASASTNVGFDIVIPDSNNISQTLFSTSTVVEFQTTTFGLGLTPTIGVAGGFIALDMNMTWTDVPQLEKPAFTFVFAPRFGKNFKFKKPDRSVAIWVGGFRASLSSETNGSINMNEVMEGDEWGTKVANGIQKVDDTQAELDQWWDNLTPVEQLKPSNKARYELANSSLTKASEVLVSAEDAIENVGNSSVQYSMDKELKDKWNFIVGSQFQLNKHWMIRAEGGFLGSRVQFMGGLQYRFGL